MFTKAQSEKTIDLYNLILIAICIGPFFTYLSWRENPFLDNFEYKPLNWITLSPIMKLENKATVKMSFSPKMKTKSNSVEVLEKEYLPGNDHISLPKTLLSRCFSELPNVGYGLVPWRIFRRIFPWLSQIAHTHSLRNLDLIYYTSLELIHTPKPWFLGYSNPVRILKILVWDVKLWPFLGIMMVV